jgi:hypothetical protein
MSELIQTANVEQTVETTVEQTTTETKTYNQVKIQHVSATVLPNGKITAGARLIPVNDAGETGTPIIVVVPDLMALAAQKPELAALVQTVKALVFEVAQSQGKLGST